MTALSVTATLLATAGIAAAATSIGTNVLTAGTLGAGATTVTALTATGNIALGDAVTDTITISSPITSDPTFATGQTVYYLRSTDTATSGNHDNAQIRGQASATSASTADVRGLYAQGVTMDGKYGGATTSIYANSIAKATSTTTTLRGILIDTETEGTPTALTNMYGLYIRNKSTIAIGGDTIGNEWQSASVRWQQ